MLRVTKLVLGEGLSLAVIGLLVGAGLAFAAAYAMRSLFFQVKPLEPLILSAAGAILLLACLAACLLPAITASRVDPMVALRNE